MDIIIIFISIQDYGRMGFSCDVTEPEELIPLCESMLEEGITGFLATIADPKERTLEILS